MNEGLEALKHIRGCAEQLNIKGIPTLFQKECYEIIEKELEEYQEIKNYMQQYGIENVEELRRVLHNNWVICQKFKTDTANVAKALEIIRNIGILRPYETSGGQCWLETMCDATKITKDNYNSLKEVGL